MPTSSSHPFGVRGHEPQDSRPTRPSFLCIEHHSADQALNSEVAALQEGYRALVKSSGPASHPAKVVHLTSVHPSWDVRILEKECRTLAREGFRVTLIAPGSGDALVHGVRVRSVPAASRRLGRALLTIPRVYRAALVENADLYHFHDPELIPVGLLLKLQGKRVIYDVHEDYPKNILSKSWLPRRLRPSIAWAVATVEALAARMLDALVLVIPMEHRRFPRRSSVLVRNFPRLEEFPPADAASHIERELLVVYVGIIAELRGALDMVRAMSRLPTTLGARLAIAGPIRPLELEDRLRAEPGFERVDLLGWLSRDQISELLARARVGICVMHPIPGYPESYPVKLFEYMAAGLAVIVSDFPVWRDIVLGAGCGLVVHPGRPVELAQALELLLKNPAKAQAMGKRGRLAVHERYNWSAEGTRLVDLYRRLLDQKTAEPAAPDT